MKNKKLNISLFLCILLFLSVKTFSVGVNDASSYITKSEFDVTISNLNGKIANLEASINSKITDYITKLPMNFEGGNRIELIHNNVNNKWTINYVSGAIEIIFTPREISGWVTGETLSGLYNADAQTITINQATSTCTNPTTQFNRPRVGWTHSRDLGLPAVTNKIINTITMDGESCVWLYTYPDLTIMTNNNINYTGGTTCTFRYTDAVLNFN